MHKTYIFIIFILNILFGLNAKAGTGLTQTVAQPPLPSNCYREKTPTYTHSVTPLSGEAACPANLMVNSAYVNYCRVAGVDYCIGYNPVNNGWATTFPLSVYCITVSTPWGPVTGVLKTDYRSGYEDICIYP